MRQTIIAGNWKMVGDFNKITQVLAQVKQDLTPSNDKAILVFPPSPYFSLCADYIKQHGAFFAWGAQNISQHEKGAFTGEVSASMVKDFGGTHVLVGHSERRSLYGETDELVAQKFERAQQSGLIPVLCVGESQAQREASETMTVVIAQIQAVIDLCGIECFSRAVLAYEPVWAIGTGLTATPQQAQEVHQEIRHYLAAQSIEIADALSILYGGSMKPDNASGLLGMADIDGGLIGGASTVPDQFVAIGNAV